MNKINTLAIIGLLCIAPLNRAMAISFSIGNNTGPAARNERISPEQLQKQTDALKALKESAPPQAFEKLTPEQTEKVLLTAIRGASRKEESPLGDTLMLVVLLLFIVSAFTIPLYLKNRRFKEFQKTLQLMIEKGVTIPAEMIENGIDGTRGRRDWRRGILLLALGGGLIVAMLITRSGAWGIGWIPMCLGGASIYLSKTEQ